MLFDKTSDILIKYSTKGCIFCEGMAGGLEQKRMFRTSLSGFHKDDVNRYIAELSKKIEESSACCQQAQSELEALRNERNEAQKDREELKKELEQTNARLEALQSGNDVLMEKAREHFEDRAAPRTRSRSYGRESPSSRRAFRSLRSAPNAMKRNRCTLRRR